MKKSDIVDAIMALDKGYKKDGLKELTAKELTAMLKVEQAPPPEVPEAPEALEAPEAPEEFISLCGHDFDPSESASCFTMCKQDEPEAYELCLAHFKTLDIKPKAKKKATGAGSNVWMHRIGSQGAQIDDILISGDAVTMGELCDKVAGTATRVRSHINHLAFDWKLQIQINEEKQYFWADANGQTKTEGTVVIGKTAYTGTKVRPAFLPA